VFRDELATSAATTSSLGLDNNISRLVAIKTVDRRLDMIMKVVDVVQRVPNVLFFDLAFDFAGGRPALLFRSRFIILYILLFCSL